MSYGVRSAVLTKNTNWCLNICGVDDEPETIGKRLTTYDLETLPLVEFYRQKGLLRTFDGKEFPELIQSDQRSTAIFKTLSAHLHQLME